MDAHRAAPDALIAPQGFNEDDTTFIKRMIAVKSNENPDVVIFPKSTFESDKECATRLTAAAKLAASILPRGRHESSSQYAKRLAAQERTRVIILPRSEDEPEGSFQERMKLQPKFEFSLHPFDAEREDKPGYARRLKAQLESAYANLAPGDETAIGKLIGAAPEPERVACTETEAEPTCESKCHPKDERARAGTPQSVRSSHEELEDDDESGQKGLGHAPEAQIAPVPTVKASSEAAEETSAPIPEVNSDAASPRLRLEAEEAAGSVEGAVQEAPSEVQQAVGVERIAINKIGFMPLKKLLVERGVPKEEVGVANKFALKAVADKWAEELKIEWFEDWS